MDKRRLKFVIPTMIIVAIGAVFMLTKYHAEVPTSSKVLIVICASIFSGILAHGLFPTDEYKEPDPKPGSQKRK